MKKKNELKTTRSSAHGVEEWAKNSISIQSGYEKSCNSRWRIESSRTISLDSDCELTIGKLADSLLTSEKQFSEVWSLRPTTFHEINIMGRAVKTPRWEQAYCKTYRYSGEENSALPLPGILQPYLIWAQKVIDPQLNGMLALWYDGSLGHYIGKHRDSTIDLIKGAPIVTISLGESRTFRMRPHKGIGFQDFVVDNGSVCVIPYATNEKWTHEVPPSRRLQGKRISLTMRAFK